MLLGIQGEATGIALAAEINQSYQALDKDAKIGFFKDLAERLDPEPKAISEAAANYEASKSAKDLKTLLQASEPPRRELFRRLNLVPGGTQALVTMRAELLAHIKKHPELERVDLDLELLLKAWFNRGFLDLKSVDWDTSASLLDKIIAYEAVHEITDWEALRQRIQPRDRRCFAFFHPRMPNEPLIFVQVALMKQTPEGIAEILSEDREHVDPADCNTAVFYSISNCQVGLRGVSFGNFLIKQVARDLSEELPQLKTFVTLSPVPTFKRWLTKQADESPAVADLLKATADPDWYVKAGPSPALQDQIMSLASHYFLNAKARANMPFDPVERFHLGNGAILDRINWMGDPGIKGQENGLGLMVNYRYDLDQVEKNHELFTSQGAINYAKPLLKLAKRGEALVAKPEAK